MSGGRRPYRKGARAERELARLLGGKRQPLSGAVGGRYAGDGVAMGLRWEVKVAADGWRRLYRWLEAADALALKADRRPWLVVMPLEAFLRLLEGVTADDAAGAARSPGRCAGAGPAGGGDCGPAPAGPVAEVLSADERESNRRGRIQAGTASGRGS